VRALHRSWQDRPHGWSYRVRWFQGRDTDDIRLQFDTPDRRFNLIVDSTEAALAYTQFVEAHSPPASV